MRWEGEEEEQNNSNYARRTCEREEMLVMECEGRVHSGNGWTGGWWGWMRGGVDMWLINLWQSRSRRSWGFRIMPGSSFGSLTFFLFRSLVVGCRPDDGRRLFPDLRAVLLAAALVLLSCVSVMRLILGRWPLGSALLIFTALQFMYLPFSDIAFHSHSCARYPQEVSWLLHKAQINCFDVEACIWTGI